MIAPAPAGRRLRLLWGIAALAAGVACQTPVAEPSDPLAAAILRGALANGATGFSSLGAASLLAATFPEGAWDLRAVLTYSAALALLGAVLTGSAWWALSQGLVSAPEAMLALNAGGLLPVAAIALAALAAAPARLRNETRRDTP